MKLNSLMLLFIMAALLSSCNSGSRESSALTEGAAVPASSRPKGLATEVVDVFEEKFGVHQGKRRNHIDGFCFSGTFTLKDKVTLNYSSSKIFSARPLVVTGRFSHKGGVKEDESAPGEYGMAFEVTLPDGGNHNFSMNTLDFFPVKTPEGFLQLMQAKVSGKPEDFAQLTIDHPEFKTYKAHYGEKKNELKSFANHQFNSINSFYFENEAGSKTAVRWSFVPKNKVGLIDASGDVDLYKEMKKALGASKKLEWEMLVTIANPDDDINDASVAWEGKHKQFVAATLRVEGISQGGPCDHKNFDPLRLQDGIEPSNDPILKFRSPTYATSFVRRLQEGQNKEQTGSGD